jgi:hypothetical protein
MQLKSAVYVSVHLRRSAARVKSHAAAPEGLLPQPACKQRFTVRPNIGALQSRRPSNTGDAGDHPDFSRESIFCQERMNSFSEALSTLSLASFTPLVAAEASDETVQVSEEAAIFRLRQIQDGHDLWGVHGGAVTGSGAPAPGPAQMLF